MNNSVDFDKFTDNYNDLLQEETDFFSPSDSYFAKYKVDIVRNNITFPVTRILEYGCGIGRNIPYLQEAFPNATIIGSDVSPLSLQVAGVKNPHVEFVSEETVNSLAPFDLIFVAGVFHHIPQQDRLRVTRNLYKLLLSRGQLIIFEHNPFNPITRRIVSNCPYDEGVTLLTKNEIKMHLLRTGFTIEKQAYCLFIPPRFKKLMAIEQYLGWLPLGGQFWTQARKL